MPVKDSELLLNPERDLELVENGEVNDDQAEKMLAHYVAITSPTLTNKTYSKKVITGLLNTKHFQPEFMKGLLSGPIGYNDDFFKQSVAGAPNTSAETIDYLLDNPGKADLAQVFYFVSQRQDATPEQLKKIVHSDVGNGASKIKAIHNPNMPAEDLKSMLNAHNPDEDVRDAILHSKSLPKEDFDQYINNNAPSSQVVIDAMSSPNWDSSNAAFHARTTASENLAYAILKHTPDPHVARMMLENGTREPNIVAHAQHFLDNHKEVDVQMGTGKLRELRHHLNAHPEKSIHKKELEKMGLDPKALGLNNLLDSKGHLHHDDVDKHIQSVPSTKYGVGSTMYGRPTAARIQPAREMDEDEIRDKAWEQAAQEFFDTYEGPDVDKDEFVDAEGAMVAHMDGHERAEYEDDSDLDDEENAKLRKEHEEYQDQLEEDHRDNFNISDWHDTDYFNERKYERARERQEEADRERYDENVDIDEYIENVKTHLEEKALREEDPTPQQKHSHDLSKVFQLKYTPEHVKKLKEAGVYGTFKSIIADSQMHAHVGGDKGLGWVRYTDAPDGTHIDEIQSDFGQKLGRQTASWHKKAIVEGWQTPEQADRAYSENLSIHPEEHLKKVSEILFGGNHPNNVIHEAFLQHNRNQGNVGKQVHIWQAPRKAHISGQTTKTEISADRLSNAEDVLNLSGHDQEAVMGYAKKHKLTPASVKAHIDQNPEIEKIKDSKGRTSQYKMKVDLPAHMQNTYHQTPPKMGYKPGKYGEIQTQSGEHQDHDTWKQTLRKTDTDIDFVSMLKSELINMPALHPEEKPAPHVKAKLIYKLKKVTPVKIKNGERHYLLHQENKKLVNGPGHMTPWTPFHHRAGKEVNSAWIPESAIHSEHSIDPHHIFVRHDEEGFLGANPDYIKQLLGA